MQPRLLFIGFIAFAASAANADPVPSAIKARYDEVTKALTSLNFKAFSAFFADEFITVDPKGKSTNRKQFLADTQPTFKMAKSAVAHERLISATTHNGIVDVKFDFILKMQTKTGLMTIHEVGTDSWKQIKGKWLFVKSVDTKMDMLMPKSPGKG